MAEKDKKGIDLSIWSKNKDEEQQDNANSSQQDSNLYLDKSDEQEEQVLRDTRVPNKFAPIDKDLSKGMIGKQSHAREIAQLLESKTRKNKQIRKQRKKRRKRFLASLKTPFKALLLLGALFVCMSWCKREGVNPLNSNFIQLLQTILGTANDEIKKINVAYDDSLDADAWTNTSIKPEAFTVIQETRPEQLDCHQILEARIVTDLGSRFIFAECAYVHGLVNDSYDTLAMKPAELKRESLLLYVILMLKRFEFSKVEKFLAGKCDRRSTSASMFFPCVADALYQMTVKGSSGITLAPKNENSNNPYAAIYWLVEFLKNGSVDISNSTIKNAIVIASAAKRPAALTYIYEVLASHIYLKGSKDNFTQLSKRAKRTSGLSYASSMQWISALSKASAVKFGADRAYGIIGTVMRGGIKLCDNMNFLEVIAYAGIRDGRTRDVLADLRSVQTCYQDRNWRNSDGLRAVSEWKIRTDVAMNKHKNAAKLLRKYRAQYGESLFYYHYYGALRLKIFKNKVKFSAVAANLNKSILLRESWESGYCLARLYLYQGMYDTAQDYVATAKSKYPKSAYGNWLFLLENEILIHRGEIDKAVSNLVAHLSSDHTAFRAYELLISAYRRKSEAAKAAKVQKVLNKLIRTVPYYSTEEGAKSPLGALALI